MRILHICWGLAPTNGAANIARMIMGEQRAAGHAVEIASRWTRAEIAACDELWCHCGWYYGIWLAVFWAKRFGKRVYWVPECCYDPMRLAYHGWKKRLVGPIEHWALRRVDVLVATCRAEAAWIKAYEPRVKKVEVSDIRRFFKFVAPRASQSSDALHVLYLGRPHVLKGTKYLEAAVKELRGVELRRVSDHHGEELERDWAWCDVLCLPTLSDNFGLVVAEALERGKRVITTDGAPAWEGQTGVVYLKGYRDGSDEVRVKMLKEALHECLDRQSV